MQEDPKTGRMKLSFEELAYTNMIVVEALVELLAEAGVLNRGELEKRIKTVKQDTKVRSTDSVSPWSPALGQ